ncbi:N-acetylglucosamine-6-phosphate deacetylase [Blastococcus deserti]|uniref:N-acetylglucosamine-6-phosphate deacetylase n=1 Tax=Blastococcus deserti TaxID=2259033 RepID=A0ABW4XFX7_9ACTN
MPSRPEPVEEPSGRHLVRGDLVSSGRRLDDAVVLVEEGRIGWVGPATSWPGDAGDLPAPAPGRLLLPGLVDVHCHGGAGHGFPEADAEGMRAAADHHLRHGTTTLIGSLVSAPADQLERRVRALLPLVASGRLAGIHLEGPFLSTARCGAQDPRSIVPGDPGLLRRLVDAGEGAIRSVTLAPETARLTELLGILAAAGVTPSFGHTDASARMTRAAIAAVGGRRLGATHLFNGMPPLHSRAPGPVAACLAAAAQGSMVVELIGDGVHLADETVATVFALVGPGQIALTTDAMAAAGMPDGRYPLGPMTVEVVGGVARLPGEPGDAGAIAGGTARLLDVVRRAVRNAGVPLPDAVTAATATPARLLGLDSEVGDVVPGRRADLLITDADLEPRAVLLTGRRVDTERATPAGTRTPTEVH